jgi:hypothetical protein
MDGYSILVMIESSPTTCKGHTFFLCARKPTRGDGWFHTTTSSDSILSASFWTCIGDDCASDYSIANCQIRDGVVIA